MEKSKKELRERAFKEIDKFLESSISKLDNFYRTEEELSKTVSECNIIISELENSLLNIESEEPREALLRTPRCFSSFNFSRSISSYLESISISINSKKSRQLFDIYEEKLKIFDAKTKLIQTFALSFPSYYGSSIVLLENNHILITGGFDYKDWVPSSRVLYLNLMNCLCENKPDLIVSRGNHTMQKFNELVFVIGGWGLTSPALAEIECFNLRLQSWEKVCDLVKPRQYHSSCLFEGKIYIIGDDDAIEIFDPAYNQTKIVELEGIVLYMNFILIFRKEVVQEYYPEENRIIEHGKLLTDSIETGGIIQSIVYENKIYIRRDDLGFWVYDYDINSLNIIHDNSYR
ncbi:unnamed protein product [Blepharisma stoltei]|uniref:Uncharacterized protein n=1 Tax=Blepharisma stoltei TaxID=1481888 RepID=A0AAU9J6T8_9CILI|nr:unnamed protein product [Blepharisma stoltei]